MQREVEDMRAALTAYIEATYHLSNPKTVAIRRQLLDRAGGISQEPYVESTPTYVGDRKFADMALPQAVQTMMGDLAEAGLLFNPPYQHQANALEHTLAKHSGGTGLVVTTGTGSGKTETFLLPVLAKLADEASARPDTFKHRAMRAMLLYPMNALVNDQLGRLRTLLGDEEVRHWFEAKAGRPAKFGRYTGRTLYPGRRDAARDQARLQSLKYYLDLEDAARGGDIQKARLVDTLKKKGRWPAKPDSSEGAYDGLRTWFGADGSRWADAAGLPRRAIERPGDSELLTRHEMQEACPDLLVTNYSMLEYMLLRPIERSLFDETRAFYETHPDEKFIFVLDEAHLYRGANGTEVAYLIRRFLDRLNLDTSRITFILTSASFSAPESAKSFAAQLIGIDAAKITVLSGRKRLEPDAAGADSEALDVFAACPIQALSSTNATERAQAVAPLLAWRNVEPDAVTLHRTSGPAAEVTVRGLDRHGKAVEHTVSVAAGVDQSLTGFAVLTDLVTTGGLVRVDRPKGLATATADANGLKWRNDDVARCAWTALRDLPVLAELKNITTGAAAEADPSLAAGAAKSMSQLADLMFGQQGEKALMATDALLELTSLARSGNGEAPLLPARIHLMFRGLPGLWACVNSECGELDEALRGGPTGALYAEPRRHCACGSQVLELWSCRSCGIAVAHAFVGSPAGHQHLWADDGRAYTEDAGVVHEAYVYLEDPGPTAPSDVLAADLDILTGRLDGDGDKIRTVWRTRGTTGVVDNCPRCNATKQISDLQTKGDEPFQQLVAVQVLGQPPRPDSEAPLKGRKSLVFSDGRQTASKLAGLLKTFAFRDSVRPLVLDGMTLLDAGDYRPSLDDAPLAVSLSAAAHKVRLRPIGDDRGDYMLRGRQALELLEESDLEADEVSQFSADASNATPLSVFLSLYPILQDRHTGLSALALAALDPKLSRVDSKLLDGLPLPTLPGHDETQTRLAVLRLWLWRAMDRRAVKLSGTPAHRDVDDYVDLWSGKFGEAITQALKKAGHADWLAVFHKSGVPLLRTVFSGVTTSTFHVRARKIALRAGEDVIWRRCSTCTRVFPENPLLGDNCLACRGETGTFTPASDPVFRSRKAFFRRSTERMVEGEPGSTPHQLVAEEHSAQLNDTNAVRAMSRNEAYELRFQDVPVSQAGQVSDPIDVLSCTTTMEVGIDIGGLTAVALRNVPPGRANYQQRAGRAGRRGAGLSSVVMFCGADSHDQSFFRNPGPIVAGPAPDPVLNLDNRVIAERQAFAFLIGRFQQARVVASTNPNIFESLGSTADFITGDAAGFSLEGLKQWLDTHRANLIGEIARLFGASCPSLDPEALLDLWPARLEETLGQVMAPPAEPLGTDDQTGETDSDVFDDQIETDNADNDRSGAGSGKLLDQLFAFGLMPRYAFPTDVATFAVFEEHPDPYRPQLAYSPQQSLNAALGQYAPGRSVWIDGKSHMSMGVWSAFDEERWKAYEARKLYFHCQVCDFATLKEKSEGRPGQFIDCPACHTKSGMGPAQNWLRPVGFAHPPGMPAAPPRMDGTVNSRPTRAKLDAPQFDDELRIGGETFDNEAGWEAWGENRDLVVTNRGTQSSIQQGFKHCPKCGRTEPADLDADFAQLTGSSAGHERPRPAKPRESDLCDGRHTFLVLGNQFKTDIAVLRLQLPPAWDLAPDRPATIIAAKSAVEALIQAASRDLEPGDIDGDYRFAPGPSTSTLLDLYIYDQAAGGAGFVKAAAADPAALARAALEVLDDCTCEDSCYQCLRSYKNRFDHAYLDRRLGADLLRACFQGVDPEVPTAWSNAALARLAEDLCDAGAVFVQHPGGLINNEGRAVVVGHPFAREVPGNAEAAAFAAKATTHKVVDILMIDRGLPLATAEALNKTASAKAAPPESTDGPPLISVKTALGAGPSETDPKVSVGAFEVGDFVMRLDAQTLSGKLGDGLSPVPKGAYCLFRPVGAKPIDPKQVYLMGRTDGSTFGATHQGWTVGVIQDLPDGARVRYRAAPERTECSSEVVAEGVLSPIAMFVRQVK